MGNFDAAVGVLRVSEHLEVCEMPHRPVATRTVFALSLFALALAVSAARPDATQAGGGCHVEPVNGYTEGNATVVRMDACSFEPTVVRVPVGTTVRFLNTAPNDHAVAGRRNLWGSEDILVPGAEFSEQFGTAGVYPYSCPLHPGMVGAVIVGESGQAAAPVMTAGAAPAPVSAAAGAGAAPAPVSAAEPEPAPILPAAIGGAVAGGVIALLVGLLVSKRRSTATVTDPVRTTATLDT